MRETQTTRIHVKKLGPNRTFENSGYCVRQRQNANLSKEKNITYEIIVLIHAA